MLIEKSKRRILISLNLYYFMTVKTKFRVYQNRDFFTYKSKKSGFNQKICFKSIKSNLNKL